VSGKDWICFYWLISLNKPLLYRIYHHSSPHKWMPVYNSENSIFQVVVWWMGHPLHSLLSLLLRSLPVGPLCNSADQYKGYSNCSELQIIPRKGEEFIHNVISFNLHLLFLFLTQIGLTALASCRKRKYWKSQKLMNFLNFRKYFIRREIDRRIEKNSNDTFYFIHVIWSWRNDMNKKVNEKKEKHYKGLGVLQTLMTPCARVQY